MIAPSLQSPPVATSVASTFEFDAEEFAGALFDRSVLTRDEWALASQVARRSASSPLQAMLDLGQIAELALADELAAWLDLPRWNPEGESAPPSGSVPEAFLRRSGALVLEDEDGQRLILSDPSDRFALDAWRRAAPSARVEIASLKEIESFLDSLGSVDEIGSSEAQSETASLDVARELSALRDLASEAPVVRFWNQTLERAIDQGASDIHIERFDRRAELRFRVDGALLDQPAPPIDLVEPLLCRIKIMAGLDIAERRRPQDGRLQVKLRGRAVDLRISLIPTLYGQDAVLRIQDRQKLVSMVIDDLGFEIDQVQRLHRAAAASHGIVLITGPTGSGKTTTLYALLRTLVSTRRKLITIEDPVEYAMDGVNQIQVSLNVDLSFSTTLRHILRHDPDVILVGEIRDAETATIAFQASLTGHLVLSTLHTNDVPGTFVRLVDMGIEPYLVGAAVELITAQRLVRVRCASCDEGANEGQACRHCSGIGYRGRVAIMECGTPTPGAKRVLMEQADEARLRAALVADGYRPMIDAARTLVGRGVTDRAEIIRVLGAWPGGEAE